MIEEEVGEHEGIFLVASPYGIFSIENEYQIHEIQEYAALGGGEDFALGSFATSKVMGYCTALARTYHALSAAIEHCSECGGQRIVKSYDKINSNKKN